MRIFEILQNKAFASIGAAGRASIMIFSAFVAAIAVSPAWAGQEDDERLEVLVAAQESMLEQQAAQIARLEARLADLEKISGAVLRPGIVREFYAPQNSIDAARDEREDHGDGAAEFGRYQDDAVVRVGAFDRAIAVPGTDLSVRIGGFVQADTLIDFGKIGAPRAFVARTITSGGAGDRDVRMTARRSRFNLDIRGPGEDADFRVFIEGDFDGDGGESLVANGSSLRLRHAFGKLGPIYAGQYWTMMTDVAAYPETLDPVSPAGRVGARQTTFRYVSNDIGPFSRFAVGIENPEADIAGAVSDERAPGPDLHGNLALAGPWGHVQLAGVARWMSAADPAGNEFSATGWGLNLTGRFELPYGDRRNNLVFGASGGDGIGRYLMEFAGSGYDAFLDAQAGELVTVTAYGGYAGGQFWWTDRLRSNAVIGAAQAELPTLYAPESVNRVTTLSANLMWNPIDQVTLGAEWQWGVSERVDGEKADASRLQVTARHQF